MKAHEFPGFADVSEPVDISFPPELEREMAEFTYRNGREKGRIDESIDARITSTGDLSRRVQYSLHIARLLVYRHSSEILHGTLYGAHYLFGWGQPQGRPTSPEELRGFLEAELVMILSAAGLTFQAVTEAFHIRYGFKSAKKQSDELSKSILQNKYLRTLSSKFKDNPAGE